MALLLLLLMRVSKLAKRSSSDFEDIWSLRIEQECDSNLADVLNLRLRSWE
jgi:hypothetical protein